MKIIKGILAFILIVFLASIYLYLNNGDTSVATTNKETQGDKVNNKKESQEPTNEEYKTLQGDKDNVVESNNALMEKFSQLKNQVNSFVNAQNKPNSKTNEVQDNTEDIVAKVVSLVNKNLGKTAKDSKGYKINNPNNPASVNQIKYKWTKSLRSGVFDEDGNFVPSPYLKTETIEPVFRNNKDENNEENAKVILRPVYTIPPNSVLSGELVTGLLGRIPVDGQVTDPFRFSIKIIDKSFYANRHTNNVLQDVIASGSASGDLLLSCVRATIDSITFIFEDGTISNHEISDVAELTNEHGVPCIKGKLVSNAAQYLGASSILSGLSSAAKAIAEAQKTTTNNSNGSSSSSVTGSPSKLAAYSTLIGGVDDTKDWYDKRAKSSFDVIVVPSGERIKILTKEQVNIDYDPNGRKLDHQFAIGGGGNETLD